jgi:hypothetical protein
MSGVALLVEAESSSLLDREPIAGTVDGRVPQILGEAGCAQADAEVVASEGPLEEAALVGSGPLDASHCRNKDMKP